MALRIGSSMILLLATASPIGLAAKLSASPPATATVAPLPADKATSQPHLRYQIVVDQGNWDIIRSQAWTLSPDGDSGIQSQLIDKLQKSGHFTVLERQASAVAQATNEDAVDANKRASVPGATAPAREQRIAGAYIITPSVVSFNETGGGSTGASINNLGGLGGALGGLFGGAHVGSKKTEDTLVLNIRISDAKNGDVIDTQTAQGKVESKGHNAGVALMGNSIGTDQFHASPAGQAVDQALDDAVKQIVKRLSQEPWQAMVAGQDARTKRVLINAGDLAGVTLGQEFNVYASGDPIRDPVSLQILSYGDDVNVGRIRVQRVEHNVSYCDIISGTTFKSLDIVKVAK